jgi:CobW/HypB/UreG family nucleotide-binding protein
VIPDGRTPVIVVTGFLGSGKTTLVNEWLKKQSETLVIVNEFGEVPVDHHLLESSEERTVALPSMCSTGCGRFRKGPRPVSSSLPGAWNCAKSLRCGRPCPT